MTNVYIQWTNWAVMAGEMHPTFISGSHSVIPTSRGDDSQCSSPLDPRAFTFSTIEWASDFSAPRL